jgi:hypothetical protein
MDSSRSSRTSRLIRKASTSLDTVMDPIILFSRRWDHLTMVAIRILTVRSIHHNIVRYSLDSEAAHTLSIARKEGIHE